MKALSDKRKKYENGKEKKNNAAPHHNRPKQMQL